MPHDEPSNEEDVYRKPGFDGRLTYHDVLKEYMAGIANASLNDMYYEWLKLLKGMYAMVQPYIRDKSRTYLDACENVLSLYNSISSQESKIQIEVILKRKLERATETIYMNSKEMLLPLSSDDDSDFDADKFLAGSD